MKKRSKIMTIAVVGILILGGGVLGVYQYAKVKVGEKVVQVLQDPTIADKILKASNNPAVLAKAQEIASNSLNKTANGSALANNSGQPQDAATGDSNASQGNAANSNTPYSSSATNTADNNNTGSSSTNLNFATRQDAIQYAMGKFSPGEIATLMGEYANRSSLNPAQKAQIKQEVLSHFTAGEVRALLAAAKK